MDLNKQISRFAIFLLFVYSGGFETVCAVGSTLYKDSYLPKYAEGFSQQGIHTENNKEIETLNKALFSDLLKEDLDDSELVTKKILGIILAKKINDSQLSESYYLLGVFYLKLKNYTSSEHYMMQSISLKEKNNEIDVRYARALYNISLAYFSLGDLNKFEVYASKSVAVGKKVFGDFSADIFLPYYSLATAYIELNEFEKVIANSDTAISISNNHPDEVKISDLAGVYHNLAVSYGRLANYSKAKIYYNKAESLYDKSGSTQDDNYLNLMNGLASTCSSLGLAEEAEKYYQKGISRALHSNSVYAFNIINNYSIYLAKTKKIAKGQKLIEDALDRAKSLYDKNPRYYFEVLCYYANYLRDNKIDINRSFICYNQCLSYIQTHGEDINLKYIVYSGYARACKESGSPEKGIELVQSILFPTGGNSTNSEIYKNPSLESLKPDLTLLKILRLKYDILNDIYKRNKSQSILETISNTSELIIGLLDKLRINISEDESRLILGDKYRNSYLNAINDFNQLYKLTSNRHYLEKAFEYSEKSKVAGLLASTRELKATQFHIPSDIANYELKLKKDINLFNICLSDESAKSRPNEFLISKWREDLLESTRKRDSLILIFEKQYPDYYAIKYNTKMVRLNEIPTLVGQNGNYINYILSDTTLYTFVANRKNQQLLSSKVDSSFFNDIQKFRSLLSMPSPSDNASRKFMEFQQVGYRLYKKLIEPVKPYLISDKLFISPDNILSYIPLETIPVSDIALTSVNYRDLTYLMNLYDISYTYSATFMEDSKSNELLKTTNLIAFAPNYPEPINIQKVLLLRQSAEGSLNDLPFARQEAEYVTKLIGGKLLENGDAKESFYKRESGKYDIIHLSMHTLLNDKDPMHSTLIFCQLNDSIEDGYLKTYEIYGIPLKAKMVFLSSCNTGSGLLLSGEGILSLARGFTYSGSKSVVMSLWEIEDKSGTEVVEKFYKNLKEGNSKSESLKKARIDFLKNSDQLRSHPYFWGTLVVYGNNEPLFYSYKSKIILGIVSLLVIMSFIFYFSKRKYS